MTLTTQKINTDVIAAGAAAVLVGGSVAIGYVFGVAALVRPLQGMTASTLVVSLCTIAGGVALIIEGCRTAFRLPLAILGGVMMIASLIAGAEWLSGRDLGVDFETLHRQLGVAGATPGRPSPTSCVCLFLLGAGIAGLPVAAKRRVTSTLAVLATLGGLFGATSLAGYILGVEFLVSWPSSTPLAPQAALAFALLGFGLWRALLLRAREQARSDSVGEARRIHLTAIWMLSLMAVVAGVATFAMAQFEYQNAVRDDLERSLRERRTFLEHAIRDHVDATSLAAKTADTAAAIASIRSGRNVHASRDALQSRADSLHRAGFSGWRYEISGRVPIVAGAFVEKPALAVPLTETYEAELLLNDGYFLRTRIPINGDQGIVGHAVGERPFPELAKLKLQADSRGQSGTLALCAAEGAGMQCFPLRSNPEPTHIPRQANGHPLPMAHALDFETGVVETLDYLNHRVIAAYGPVGFTGLGMVIKIDVAELNRPLGDRFGYAMLMLFALVVPGVYLLHRRLAPLTEALEKSREEAARVAQQFKAAAESSLDGCFIMSAVRDSGGAVVDFRVDYKNASGEVLTGRASEDVIGRTLTQLLPRKQVDFLMGRYRRIVETGVSLSEEFPMSRDAGARWISHQAVRLGDGVSVTARDITQRKAIEAQLRNRADNDVLTGLPNRTLFFERLEHALALARRARTGVAVLFVDVDHFKKVNDTHGHAAGDTVLVEFSRRLRGAVRDDDVVARLSGDEFAVVVANVDAIDHVERIAAHIIESLKTSFVVDGAHLAVGATIGIAFCPNGMDTAQALVAHADRQLYDAKAAGRGRFLTTRHPRAA